MISLSHAINQLNWVLISQVWEDPLEKWEVTHSSILASKILWTTYWLAKSWTQLSNVHVYVLTFLVAQMVKNLPAMRDTQVQPLGREGPWKRKWQPTLVFLPGKPHGHGRLLCCIHGITKSRTWLGSWHCHCFCRDFTVDETEV